MYKISIEEIEAFLTVAAYKSFTRAAAELYVSQPTVTKWIKHLEAELGVRLLQRSSRSVELTSAGNLLNARWGGMRMEWETSVHLAQQLSDAQGCGCIRIGLLYGFDFESKLAPLASQFESLHPDLKIDPNLYGFDEIKEKAGSCDFLFTTNLEMESAPQYRTLRMARIPFYLAVAPQHPLAQRGSVTPWEIRRETFVVISSQISSNIMAHFDEAFRPFQASPTFVTVENVPSQFMKVSRQEGVAITGKGFVKDHEAAVRLLKLENFSLEVYSVCAWRDENLLEPARRFRDFMLETFAGKISG